MPLPQTIRYLVPGMFHGKEQFVRVPSDGLVVLVGPNATGKTQVLRALRETVKTNFPQGAVRYVSPGRLAPMEEYRSDVFGGYSGGRVPDTKRTGVSEDYVGLRLNASSIAGDLIGLKLKPDLRLKIEARLESLFGRSLQLEWSSDGLHLSFFRRQGVVSYSGAAEASGLLHMISLLTALYDDGIGNLFIDEPEVSLHPQYQSFLHQEIRKSAGDPSIRCKKLIVISTHSPAFVRVRRPADLSRIVFFTDSETPPKQISAESPVLTWRSTATLVARMSESHRLAFFAPRVFLVEGPSDEYICEALAARLELNLDIGGVQIVPIQGKGDFRQLREAFGQMGKKTSLITDLDTFTDEGSVALLAQSPEADEVASKAGHADAVSMCRSVRSALITFLDERYDEIRLLAEQHRYWLTRESDDETKARRRAACAVLLTATPSKLKSLSESWEAMRHRADAALSLLELSGCFVLRRGTIEDYFLRDSGPSKPGVAAEEADRIREMDLSALEVQYDDLIRGLRASAVVLEVDEARLVRDLLLAALAPILSNLDETTTDEDLQFRTATNLGDRAQLFRFSRERTAMKPTVRVELIGAVDVVGFPFTVSRGDDIDKWLRENVRNAPR